MPIQQRTADTNPGSELDVGLPRRGGRRWRPTGERVGRRVPVLTAARFANMGGQLEIRYPEQQQRPMH